MALRTYAAFLAALSICGCATPNSPTTAGGPPAPSSTCLTSTGSRVPDGPDRHCVAQGRSYSQTDIDQTGQTTAAGALRNLDPSLTIGH